jgi:hypothetical protein
MPVEVDKAEDAEVIVVCAKGWGVPTAKGDCEKGN